MNDFFDRQIYGGVRGDAETVSQLGHENNFGFAFLMSLDTLLCVPADTISLVITVPNAMIYGQDSKKPDIEKHMQISLVSDFGIGNGAIVEVDPNSKDVNLVWREFKPGFVFAPYERLEFSSGNEKYMVTDYDSGNKGITINKTLYKFDLHNEKILIRFGEGISIVQGSASSEAKHIYDN